jgi:hypothetical protein
MAFVHSVTLVTVLLSVIIVQYYKREVVAMSRSTLFIWLALVFTTRQRFYRFIVNPNCSTIQYTYDYLIYL